MRFLSRKHSEIAQRLGCISESEKFYLYDRPQDKIETAISAFTESDFTGSSPQARKNAELVWGSEAIRTNLSGHIRTIYGPDVCAKYEYMRHQIIDAEDGVALIEAELEKHGNSKNS